VLDELSHVERANDGTLSNIFNFQGEASTSTPDGLDVPMKKKKSKKQASDFAKELDEMDAEDNEGDAVPEIEGDLGDDVFEKSGTAGEVDSGRDAWVLEGREATYPEVSFTLSTSGPSLRPAAHAILLPSPRAQPRTRRREAKIHHRPAASRS